MARSKYKRLPDLYNEGKEVPLKGDLVMWLQVLNPFERQEARKDAQTARARLILAMKQEGTPEMTQAEAMFAVDGREQAIARLVEMESGEAMVKVLDAIRDDPDWKERLEIAERSEEILAREPEDAERKLLTRINEEYLREVNERLGEEQEYARQRLEQLTDDDLRATYREKYIEQRGNEVATAEYALTELWLAARVCDAEWNQAEERWLHGGCNGHRERAYETKEEVRSLPDALYELLTDELSNLAMTVREAKNSDRQRSSSGSSPLPSEGEESMPSTPSETPDAVPGPSLLQSTTPSSS